MVGPVGKSGCGDAVFSGLRRLNSIMAWAAESTSDITAASGGTGGGAGTPAAGRSPASPKEASARGLGSWMRSRRLVHRFCWARRSRSRFLSRTNLRRRVLLQRAVDKIPGVLHPGKTEASSLAVIVGQETDKTSAAGAAIIVWYRWSSPRKRVSGFISGICSIVLLHRSWGFLRGRGATGRSKDPSRPRGQPRL